MFVAVLCARYSAPASQYPFLLFLAVVLVCSAFLDRGNGFLATGLSTILADYYLLAPRYSLLIAQREDRVALVIFVVLSLTLATVFEILHVGLVELALDRERARKALRDRQMLLEEFAHRTRNDLSSVVTLLNLQSRTASAEAKDALIAAAERVQSIARVHRRLELREDRIADLRLSRLANTPIALLCHLEGHSISVEKALPIGLVINEAVTNSAKHAFPTGRAGTINIDFRRTADVYVLSIIDDGVGRAPESSSGMGSRIMEMLAAQLESHISYERRDPGTAVIVKIAVKMEVDVRA